MARSAGKGFSLFRALRSPAHETATLVLLAWLLLAQTLLVVHRVDHSLTEHGVQCALCVAADQSSAPAELSVSVPFEALPTDVAASVAITSPRVAVHAYRSRAPPLQPSLA